MNKMKKARDGLYTEWYENGQKKWEMTFKDGEMISKKLWNEDVLRKNNQLPLTHSFFSLSHISTKGSIYGTFFILTYFNKIFVKFCHHRSLL